ncbi:hypothetical protein A3L09_00630 [Thermococcus profundus]|uniref:Uncharacterized protein n=2 Tax=Thermococcus profundus TaxID=49899 RepID=A0A2Z2M6U6_THEPR|nr:hypothetical protein A3L09_00630 [Thermococcus profundus]
MWKKPASLLGILVLAAAITIPAVGAATPTEDAVMHIQNQTWSGVNSMTLVASLRPLVGSKTIGPIYKSIPWDGLDVISAAILVHGVPYDLRGQSGQKFMVVYKIGATDYGRGIYREINEPMAKGYEKFGVQLRKHYFTAGGEATEAYKVIFIVTASSEQEAEQKVETSLGASVPILDDLLSFEAGVDYSVTNVYKTFYSETYGVEVTFYRHVYYAELEFNGTLTRTLYEKCPLGYCPLSSKPTPSVEMKASLGPESSYYRTYYRDFDVGTDGMLYFVGPDEVYGLGDYTMPLNFEEVNG